MFVEILIAITVLFVLFLIYSSRNLYVWSKQGVKGPKSLPFFGNSIDNMRRNLHDIETERYNTYGRIYGYLDFMKPFLTVAEPELIKQVAVKDFHLFRNHIPLLPGDPIFSKALGFLEDDDWKRVRTLLGPAFSNSRIKQMFSMMDACVANTLKHLKYLADKKIEVDLKNVCSAHSIDTITRCAFSIETNGHSNPNDEILVYAGKFTSFPLWRVILTRFLPRFIQKAFGVQLVEEKVLKFFRNVVEHVAESRKGIEHKYSDFLQVMLNAKNGVLESKNSFDKDLSEEKAPQTKRIEKRLAMDEIIAQFPEFLVGGYEPAATILMYAIYTLAVNEDIQEKLFKEVNGKLSTQEVNYDTVTSLDYLDAFLNETLRFYGPFVNTDRVSSKDYKLGDTGIIVPKGAVINFPLFAIHHDSKFYPEPYTFKPERFLPENSDQLIPYTFMPFGVGPRICVAMNFAIVEIKLTLAKIVMEFKFKSTERTDIPPKHFSRKYFYHCEPLYVAVENRV